MKASRSAALIAGLLIAGGALAGCTGTPVGGASSPAGSATPDATSSATETPTPEPTPTSTVTPIAIPDDCREILSADVLEQLGDTPLNDPAFGESGVMIDGSLRCIWGDPRADTTKLITSITPMNRGPALDMLNDLADDEDFTCFAPDGGTRCEKTWENTEYPVMDGRTLFWRDDILIDTRYSNLAPSGYTSSIVEHLFD